LILKPRFIGGSWIRVNYNSEVAYFLSGHPVCAWAACLRPVSASDECSFYATTVFRSFFWLVTKIFTGSLPHPLPQSCTNNDIFAQKWPSTSVAHPVKSNKWQSIKSLISMRRLSLINAAIGPVFPVPVSRFWSSRKKSLNQKSKGPATQFW